VESALAKDGQRPVFLGKRSIIGGTAAGNVFTLNENGYGFNIERDPENNELCVRAAFRNTQLNRIDNVAIPEWARYMHANPDGIDVKKAYRAENGGRLVFFAQSYRRGADGIEVPGKSIALMAGTKDDLASVWSIDSQHVPDSLFNMREFRIVNSSFDHFFARGLGNSAADKRSRP
jgi:hypothetical protein